MAMANTGHITIGCCFSPKRKDESGDWFLTYDVERCDRCGCDIMAANAYGIQGPRHKLETLGSSFRTTAPDEGMLIASDEGLDLVTCFDCYNKHASSLQHGSLAGWCCDYCGREGLTGDVALVIDAEHQYCCSECQYMDFSDGAAGAPE